MKNIQLILILFGFIYATGYGCEADCHCCIEGSCISIIFIINYLEEIIKCPLKPNSDFSVLISIFIVIGSFAIGII